MELKKAFEGELTYSKAEGNPANGIVKNSWWITGGKERGDTN